MIHIIDITYSDEPPMRPENADFGVTIDFAKGQSDPVQVFAAMAEMLAGYSRMDQILIGNVAPNAEPVTVIEDVEAASITAWVRAKIEKIDDDALKSLEWKKQIGVYAVKAKYRITEFLNERETEARSARLSQLSEDLEELGRAIASPYLLPPPPPPVTELVGAMNQVQHGKAMLTRGEKVWVKSEREPDYEVDVTAHEEVDQTEPVSEEIATTGGGATEMVLLIKKADLIGKSQWEFRHGPVAIKAAIRDEPWLEEYHRGEESASIPPGSRMRAIVDCRHQYNARGDLVGTEYTVLKVIEIIRPTRDTTQSLFGANDD